MKKFKIIAAMVIVSFLLMLGGLFADKETMKIFAVLLMLLTAASTFMTWKQPSFLSRQTIILNYAGAIACGISLVGLLVALCFVVNSFIATIPNRDFIVFSSIFVSMSAVRAQMAYDLREYE